MKYLLIILSSLFILFSCNNREEKERALKELDSRQKLIADIDIQLKQLDDSLIASTGNLEVAKDNLIEAKEFQLFRSESDRTYDIKNATENIIYLERYISDIKKRIENLKSDQEFATKQIDTLKSILTN